MAFLNTITTLIGQATAIAPNIVAPSKMWHLLILNVFDFVADYGWRIVLFTVLLKLLLSPLDFYQRYKMNKNQKITERLKPTMEKLQKQYGDDKQAFSQKQMELNRKEGYSYFSSCLPMIVTMVVFITLWLSMQTVAQYMTFKEYITMYDEYTYATEQVESGGGSSDRAVEIGQDVVYHMYYYGIDDEFTRKLKEDNGLAADFELHNCGKVQTSFLWIKNVWAPDVPWGDQAILDWKRFGGDRKSIGKFDSPGHGLTDEQLSAIVNENKYNEVMGKLLNDTSASRTNGYLVLPILVVLLSVGSQLLSTFQQKKAGQVNEKGGVATSMKVMMFIMPVMMAVFAIQYASIFTLYMVTNSACTLFFNFAFTGIIKLIDGRRRSRHYGISTGSTRAYSSDKSPIIHYVKGANPDAGAKPVAPTAQQLKEAKKQTKIVADEEKKNKKSDDRSTRVVKQSARPDPRELMSMGSADPKSSKKKK